MKDLQQWTPGQQMQMVEMTLFSAVNVLHIAKDNQGDKARLHMHLWLADHSEINLHAMN